MTAYSSNLRLPKKCKEYWENQLKIFAEKFNVKRVYFGKQDIRGTESITFFDDRGCVPAQEHFPNKTALLHYVQGFNEAFDGFSRLSKFLKKEGEK